MNDRNTRLFTTRLRVTEDERDEAILKIKFELLSSVSQPLEMLKSLSLISDRQSTGYPYNLSYIALPIHKWINTSGIACN